MTTLVVLFSVANPNSYDVITAELVEEVKKYHRSDVSPAVILVGTDTEKRNNRCFLSEEYRPGITEEMGQQLASKIKAVKYIELSSWDDDDGKKKLLEETVFTSLRHNSTQKYNEKHWFKKRVKQVFLNVLCLFFIIFSYFFVSKKLVSGTELDFCFNQSDHCLQNFSRDASPEESSG